jgi:hypothetical protein
MALLNTDKHDHAAAGSTHAHPVILDRVPRVPVATEVHGEPDNNGKISLTVHDKAFLLTVSHRPDLCTAVLQSA